jgi:DnaJ-class molecular chaperone
MEFKDYYKLMGLERSATADDIKKSYRKLARKYHPDVSKEPQAEARFKEMQEAYEVLKDPEKRAAYDQLGANWKAGQDFRPPPDWDADSASARPPNTAIFSSRCSAADSAPDRRGRTKASSFMHTARTRTPRSRSISKRLTTVPRAVSVCACRRSMRKAI